MRDDGHHDVQLELPRLCSGRHGDVVPDHLEADLIHHFGDGRIHFPGHDAGARLHRRQQDLRETCARSGRQQPQIARDLAEVGGVGPHGARESCRIAHRLHQLHAILAFAQLEPRHRAQVLHHQRRISRLGVESGTHRRTTDAEIAQVVRGAHDPVAIPLDRVAVGGEFLAEADRGRILQVGPARLHDPVKRLAFGRERPRETGERLGQRRQLRQGTEPNRGGDHVVRGLGHVDVIIRMDRLVLAAPAAQQLIGAVREHLIAIHVVGRAGTRLIRIDDELVAVPA